MAEILLAANLPPRRRAESTYHAGDVIAIRPDGHQWGRLERAPTFYRLRVSGPWTQLAAYDQAAKSSLIVSVRKRRFAVDLSQFTLAERDLLDAGETVEISDTRFRDMIVDHVPTARVFR